MSRFISRAAAVSALLLPIVAQAADAPAPKGSTLPTPGGGQLGAGSGGSTLPAPNPAPKEPEIDAAAQEVLKQASAAYKALKSYADTADIVATGFGEKPETIKVTTAYQRGGKVLVKRTESEGTSIFATDGKAFYVVLPQVKGKYLKRTLPAQVKPEEVVLARTAGAGPGLDLWLGGEDVLASIRPALESLKMGEANKVDGVDVDNVVFKLKGAQNPPQITFSFGKADHLLRRIVMERTVKLPDGSEKKVIVTENRTGIQADTPLTAASLQFVPPAGAKASDSLEPPTYDERLKPGVLPYAISAKDLSGKPLTLAQYKGKVVLLDFWATWCGPCMMEMPNVLAAYKKFKAQGFDVVGISGDQTKADLQRVVTSSKIPWRQVFDGPDGPINRKYGIVAIPTMFLIGRDGKIAAVNVRGEELEPAIRKALAQKVKK